MNKNILISLITILITLSLIPFIPGKAATYAPVFQFPVKCNFNKDCWISEYPDIDTSPGWHDYTGGPRTTNSHLGTDVIIKNIDEMNKGIPVLAAAGGIVTAIRDGVNDINVKEIDANAVDKMGCGNAAAITIENGWTTIYCHMKKGSVAVKEGDRVSTGQRIGYVGMSGLAETPHLHFQVQHFNETIDPFTGNSIKSNSKTIHPLWSNNALKQLKYIPAFIYNIGVSDKAPKLILNLL